MFSSIIKNLSILKKFLFINLIIFLFIGSLTIIYLSYVQPNLIKKKTSIHIQILNNTIQNLNRLNVKFNKEDIKNFLFSKRFLFQSVDRVVFLDEDYDIIADTNTLDLDPRSFSQRIDIVEFDISTNNNEIVTQEDKINQKKDVLVYVESGRTDILRNLKKRKNFNVKLLNKFKKIQLPLAYKKRNSRFIIKNKFTQKSVKDGIKKILKDIKNERSSS